MKVVNNGCVYKYVYIHIYIEETSRRALVSIYVSRRSLSFWENSTPTTTTTITEKQKSAHKIRMSGLKSLDCEIGDSIFLFCSPARPPPLPSPPSSCSPSVAASLSYFLQYNI